MIDSSEKSSWFRRFRVLVLLLLVPAGILALSLLYVFYWPNTFEGVSEKAFYVSRGETFAQVVDSLTVQGVIRDRGLFAFVANLHGGDTRVQVGKYLFKSGISNNELFNSLRTGKLRVFIAVTLREGLTARRQARILHHALGIDSTKFLKYAADTSFARTLGLPPEPLEGTLFPDTYSFSWQPDEKDVVRHLVEAFKKFYTDTLKAREDELGLTMREVLTMASLVEGETRIDDERPLVAGVYYNRLKHHMRLQADPTVQYLLPDGPRRLYYADLATNSPYNTYLHGGLPPGPVNNPGRASIIAALYPAHHQFLFFVANGAGGHSFSKSYEEHERKVRMFRRQMAGKAAPKKHGR